MRLFIGQGSVLDCLSRSLGHSVEQVCFCLLTTGGDPQQPWPDCNLPPPHHQRHEPVQPAPLCQVLQQVKQMHHNSVYMYFLLVKCLRGVLDLPCLGSRAHGMITKMKPTQSIQGANQAHFKYFKSQVLFRYCLWTLVSFYSRRDLDIERPIPGGNIITRTLKWVVNKHCTYKQCDDIWGGETQGWSFTLLYIFQMESVLIFDLQTVDLFFILSVPPL